MPRLLYQVEIRAIGLGATAPRMALSLQRI